MFTRLVLLTRLFFKIVVAGPQIPHVSYDPPDPQETFHPHAGHDCWVVTQNQEGDGIIWDLGQAPSFWNTLTNGVYESVQDGNGTACQTHKVIYQDQNWPGPKKEQHAIYYGDQQDGYCSTNATLKSISFGIWNGSIGLRGGVAITGCIILYTGEGWNEHIKISRDPILQPPENVDCSDWQNSTCWHQEHT